MAKPELGAKRQCQSCATKFYDLNKNPIVCPKCGTIFHVAAISRVAGRVEEDDDGEIEKESPDTVSLEEVEESENPVEAMEVDEVEIEDDAADDDTFLEEEEGENDDVAGLIDGDIETDEEG